MPPVTVTTSWNWYFGWVAVFAANLAVPLWFGWEVTRHGGRLGMVAATALMFVASLFIVPRSSGLRLALVVGGTFTAVSQGFPLLHIMVGVISIEAVNGFGFQPEEGLGNSNSLTESGGFFVTLLTGALLLIAALVCGVCLGLTGRAVDRQVERKLNERSAGLYPVPEPPHALPLKGGGNQTRSP